MGQRERGSDATRPILVVIDWSKALRRGVLDVFDRPVLVFDPPGERVRLSVWRVH